MPTETSCTAARAHLAELWDQAVSSREPIIVRRRGSDDLALISAAELRSLMETAHLPRSPRNAGRLATSLERARQGTLAPEPASVLRDELGLNASG